MKSTRKFRNDHYKCYRTQRKFRFFFFSKLNPIILTFLLFPFYSSAQENFNDIYKLCEAKQYDQAIPKLYQFIKQKRKHIAAHYELAKAYEAINNIDSAIYFYQATSDKMNVIFLTTDLKYDEFYQATKDCGVLVKVKCARSYLEQRRDRVKREKVAGGKPNESTIKKAEQGQMKSTFDRGFSIIENSNGDFLIFGISSRYLYVLKLDIQGNLLWDKTYMKITSHNLEIGGEYIVEVENNNYIIAYNKDRQFGLLKIDDNGSIVFDKSNIGWKGHETYINTIIKDSKGDILVVGSVLAPYLDNQNNEGMVMKLNSSGEIIWQDAFGDAWLDESFYSIVENKNSEYVLIGTQKGVSQNRTKNIFMVKINQSGKELWEKVPDDPQSAVYCYSAYLDEVDRFVTTGISGSKIFFKKFSASGEYISNYSYYQGYGYSVYKLKDGSFLIAGKRIIDKNSGDAILIKITNKGDSIIWDKFFGINFAKVFSVKETKNSNIIATGASGNDILFAKFDPNGELLLIKYYGRDRR